MISEDGCDGCIVHSGNICFYNWIEGWPCKCCLIKMMCTRDCADLTAHTKRRYAMDADCMARTKK